MPKKAKKPDNVSQADWDAVRSPRLSRKALSELRPAREVLPEIVARATRGPGKKPKKELTSIRLDPAILEAFRATGDGWQGRVNATLARVVAEGRIVDEDGEPLRNPRAKKRAVKNASTLAGRKRA